MTYGNKNRIITTCTMRVACKFQIECLIFQSQRWERIYGSIQEY